jgi:hypothetical protein|tara:strand:- start:1020 stop:1166 length:147 start_codon:yes stop_codon:yes gene_type:complete
MDNKDFLHLIKFRDKETKKQAQITYTFRQRQSRPRAKQNIINPKQVGI